MSEKEKAIKSALKDVSFLSKKSREKLPELLDDSEAPLLITECMHIKFGKGPNGVICATDKRILFVSKGIISGEIEVNLPYQTITSVEYSSGLLTGKMFIHHAGGKMKLTHLSAKTGKELAYIIQSKLSRDKKEDGIENITDELSRLADLKENGMLTDDEFKAAKAKILNH